MGRGSSGGIFSQQAQMKGPFLGRGKGRAETPEPGRRDSEPITPVVPENPILTSIRQESNITSELDTSELMIDMDDEPDVEEAEDIPDVPDVQGPVVRRFKIVFFLLCT